jgi:hypothetical protein
MRSPNHEAHHLRILGVAGEDRWRIGGGDRAQDKAGGIETVGKHEVDRTENFNNDPDNSKCSTGRRSGSRLSSRLAWSPPAGLAVDGGMRLSPAPSGGAEGFSALRLLIDMMKDVERSTGDAAPLPEPRRLDAADREVVQQFVARLRRQTLQEIEEAKAAEPPG